MFILNLNHRWFFFLSDSWVFPHSSPKVNLWCAEYDYFFFIYLYTNCRLLSDHDIAKLTAWSGPARPFLSSHSLRPCPVGMTCRSDPPEALLRYLYVLINNDRQPLSDRCPWHDCSRILHHHLSSVVRMFHLDGASSFNWKNYKLISSASGMKHFGDWTRSASRSRPLFALSFNLIFITFI